MAVIAGIQDFRQEGPPADIGTFQMATTVLMFQFTFSGATYTVAMASGARGWTLVDSEVAGTDQVVIQSAVGYVAALGGGLIFFGPYTFELTDDANSGIRLDTVSDISFRGSGRGTVLRSAVADMEVFNCTALVGCTWNNLKMVSRGTVASNQCIDMDGAIDCLIYGCWFESTQTCIGLDAQSDSDTHSNIIFSNIFESWGVTGILLLGDGVGHADDWCIRNIIYGNHLYGTGSTGSAIYLYEGSSHNIVALNEIYDPGLHGIDLSVNAHRNNVYGNTVINAGGRGINVNDGDHVTVSENKIITPTTVGIQIYDSDYVNVHDNTIETAGDIGINFAGGVVTEGNSATDNDIYDPGSDGIYANQHNEICISDNRIKSPDGDGIYITQSSNGVIADNKVIGPHGTGTHGGASCALYIRYNCHDNDFSGNVLQGAAGDGVRIYSDCDDNLFAANVITGNTGWGVIIENTNIQRNKFAESNLIRGNTAGQMSDGGGDTKLPWVFFPVTYAEAGMALLGAEPVAPCANGQSAAVSFYITKNLEQLVRAYLMVIPGATQGAADWDIFSDYSTTGEAYNTNSEADAATTYNVTVNQPFDIELVALGFFASISYNDRGGIRLLVSTAGHDVNVFGLRLEYV